MVPVQRCIVNLDKPRSSCVAIYKMDATPIIWAKNDDMGFCERKRLGRSQLPDDSELWGGGSNHTSSGDVRGWPVKATDRR